MSFGPFDGHKGSDNISEWLHGGLDALGLIPGLGVVPDALNAAFYVIEGNFPAAGMSAAAMVPIFGYGATATKYALKISREAAERTARGIGAQLRRIPAPPVGTRALVRGRTAANPHSLIPHPDEDMALAFKVFEGPSRRSPALRAKMKHELEIAKSRAHRVDDELEKVPLETIVARYKEVRRSIPSDVRVVTGRKGDRVLDAGAGPNRTGGMHIAGDGRKVRGVPFRRDTVIVRRDLRERAYDESRVDPSVLSRIDELDKVSPSWGRSIGDILDEQNKLLDIWNRQARLPDKLERLSPATRLSVLIHEAYHHHQLQMLGPRYFIGRNRDAAELAAYKWQAIQCRRIIAGQPLLRTFRGF